MKRQVLHNVGCNSSGEARGNEGNMLAQHHRTSWTQQCWMMLHNVGTCYIKFEIGQTFHPTSLSTLHLLVRSVKRVATCCIIIFLNCHDSRKIVWLARAHPNALTLRVRSSTCERGKRRALSVANKDKSNCRKLSEAEGDRLIDAAVIRMHFRAFRGLY